MGFVLLAAFGVGLVVLLRRRLRVSGLDWRSLLGFACGGVLGLWLGKLLQMTSDRIVAATGLPWLGVRLLLVIVAGLMAAAPARRVLEEAFPPRGESTREKDATRSR